MNISIFGLGYVGCITGACLAKAGNKIIGVDIDTNKVSIINSGRSPIVEPEIEEIIKKVVSHKQLIATTDYKSAILNSELSLVCVGTPGDSKGKINLSVIKKTCYEIGSGIKDKNEYHLVVIRSTMIPGTTEEVLIPILEESSNKKIGQDFGICVHPEFLREGSSVYDYYNPPLILIGESNSSDGEMVAKLYPEIKADIKKTPIKIAEMTKYVSNIFHSLKVTFANEIGNLCKELEIDSHEVMNIFCADKKLNISSSYLKPGFAFGGSCLPKDLKAVLYKAKQCDLKVPLLNSILSSNQYQIEKGIDIVLQTGKKKIGILGLSFKSGTDDLRESPMVVFAERLLGKGLKIKIYDENVSLAKVFGSNKKYIEEVIPHISSLICSSINEIVEHSEVMIIGNNDKEFKKVLDLCRENQIIIDLVRISKKIPVIKGKYIGLCW